jgi:hypothetical protein
MAEAFVERDRGRVLDGDLELHPRHARGPEPTFKLDQELPAQAVPPGRRRHVERDDVTVALAPTPAEHERDDASSAFGHDRLGSLAREKRPQLGSRIRDAGRKAFLIEDPHRLEIGGLVVAKATVGLHQRPMPVSDAVRSDVDISSPTVVLRDAAA